MTGLEKVCFWLMAALPWLQLTCILTDREQPTSRRYWWYLPPSILSLLTATAVGLPRIIDKRIGGFGCWCTLIFTFACAYHDETEGLENLHGKLICLSMICTAFATVWCCTIKVDIGNSKSQYIEMDKQEATKDGSESTKIQHGI